MIFSLKAKRISYAMSEPDLVQQIGLIITEATQYNKPLICLSPNIQKECHQYDPLEALRKIVYHKHSKDKIQYLTLVA